MNSAWAPRGREFGQVGVGSSPALAALLAQCFLEAIGTEYEQAQAEDLFDEIVVGEGEFAGGGGVVIRSATGSALTPMP